MKKLILILALILASFAHPTEAKPVDTQIETSEVKTAETVPADESIFVESSEAVDETTAPEHQHELIETICLPTCTEEGVQYSSCQCGYTTEKMYTPKADHKYEVVAVIEATCVSRGYSKYVCACGDSYTEYSDKAEHNYTETVVPATCTSEGYTEYVCVCGASYKDTFVGKKEHEYSVSRQVASTCTVCGYTEYRCICGDSYTVSYSTSVHQYVVSVVSPSCTHTGYAVYTCPCGDSYTDGYINMLPHFWSDWSVVRESTTSATGIKMRSCLMCEKTETAAIAKKENVSPNDFTPIDVASDLSPNAAIVVNAILQNLADNTAVKGNRMIYVGAFTLSAAEVCEVKFYLACRYGYYDKTIAATSFYLVGESSYDVSYELAPLRELEEGRQAFERTIRDIVASFEAGSKEELVNKAFLYLANTLSYNANQADAALALKNGTGSCNAYAILFKLMLAEMGIDSDVCVGFAHTGGYHAWNRVMGSDGQYKYYDLTFYESTGSNKYFGASSLRHKLVAADRYLANSELN